MNFSVIYTGEFAHEFGAFDEILLASAATFFLFGREGEEGLSSPTWTLGNDEKFLKVRSHVGHHLGKPPIAFLLRHRFHPSSPTQAIPCTGRHS